MYVYGKKGFTDAVNDYLVRTWIFLIQCININFLSRSNKKSIHLKSLPTLFPTHRFEREVNSNKKTLSHNPLSQISSLDDNAMGALIAILGILLVIFLFLALINWILPFDVFASIINFFKRILGM